MTIRLASRILIGSHEIYRRLGRLPLAVLLAAVRTRLLSPASLPAQLDRPLAILTTAPRDLPARQRALSDTIARTYELLSAAERRLFRCVGVFAGSWAAEHL